MADIKTTIEDLRVWQQARIINKEIYKFTRRSDFEKDYRFVQQIRAAAGAIMDNIAEGYGRGGNNEFIQLSVMLHNLLEKLKQSEIKGAKYQTTPH
jgi:four helix bundle protein